MKFNADDLRKLEPQGKPFIVWDEGYGQGASLGCRVAPSGVLSLFVQYRLPGGKQSKKTIETIKPGGAIPSIASVRREARAWVYSAQAAGLTTSEQAALEAREAAAAHSQRLVELTTIRELGDHFLALKAENLGGALQAYADGGEASARRAVKRAELVWGDKPLTDLRGTDGKRLVKYISEAHGPTSARKAVRLLSPMLAYGRNELDLDIHPAVLLKTGAAGDKPRRAVMSCAEIEQFLDALQVYETITTGGHDRRDAADCLRFIYFTACRQGEAFKAQWMDVDLDAGTWYRPAAKRKMRNKHTQLLPHEAIDVLRRIKARREQLGLPVKGEDWVWPSTVEGSRKPHRTSIDHAFRSVLKLAGLDGKGLLVHDTRATRVTYWGKTKGIDLARIADAIGSSVQELQKTYTRETEQADTLRDLFSG